METMHDAEHRARARARLPDATRPDFRVGSPRPNRRARRRRSIRAPHRAGREAIGDATVRMLAYNGSVPGPTLKIPAGRDRDGPRHQPGRPRGNRPLARPAAREPLRRDPRHAGADSRRRELHVPGARPRPRRLLVPPAHPRGLRPGDGPVREHPRRPGRAGLLAAGEPRAVPDARRHPDRGRKDRRLQRVGDDARRDGPLRQRHARLGRAGPRTRPRSAARSCASTSPTPPTPASST